MGSVGMDGEAISSSPSALHQPAASPDSPVSGLPPALSNPAAAAAACFSAPTSTEFVV